MYSLIRHIDRIGAIAITTTAILVVCLILLTVKGDKAGSYGSQIQGIDISHHQGKIDWEQVAADGKIQFVYIKASEGATHRDSRYKQNISEARQAGIPAGSYHYFHPAIPVAEQIRNFTDIIKTETQDLIPVVDIEESNNLTGKQVCDSLKRFTALLKDYCGKQPIVYTHQRFYNDYLQKSFCQAKLWIARYGFLLFKPRPRLEDMRNCTIWQYSNRGRIDGINSLVDLNTLSPGHSLEQIMLQTSN